MLMLSPYARLLGITQQNTFAEGRRDGQHLLEVLGAALQHARIIVLHEQSLHRLG